MSLSKFKVQSSRLTVLLPLLALLSPVHLQAAVITGLLYGVNNVPLRTTVTFKPLSSPQLIDGVYYSTVITTVRSSTNGGFTNTVVQGDYDLIIGGVDIHRIAVTNAAGPYNFTNLLNPSALQYIYTTPGGLVKIHSADTTFSFLSAKLTNGANIAFTTNNPSGNAQLVVAATGLQSSDGTLTALAGLDTTTGFVVQTNTDAFTKRSLVAGSSKISISNTNGVAGNPTIDAVEGNFTLANIGGNLPVSKLNSGTGASSSTFWRGDGTWSGPTTPLVLDVNTTAVGNIGTGEDDLMTKSIAGATLAVNKQHLQIVCSGSFGATANAKQLKAKWGATQLFASGSQIFNAGDWVLDCQILRTGPTNQLANVAFHSGNSLLSATATVTSPTEDLSAALIFKLTGEATADDDLRQKSMTVHLWPAP